MKTFARARAVAANAMKTVANVIDPTEGVGVPWFNKMEHTELIEMCREEGITVQGKLRSELIDSLEEAYELYPSDV